MTLPASGQITLGNVRTELGASGQISLAQASVRALFGVPSGQISLSQGRGKSSTMWLRPSLPSDANGAKAHDTGTTAALDSSTYAYYESVGEIIFSGFSGASNLSGLLKILIDYSLVSTDGASTNIYVHYSTNNGSSWTQVAYYSAIDTITGNTINLSIPLTSIPSQLKVKVYLSTDTWAGSYSAASVYDIAFVA